MGRHGQVILGIDKQLLHASLLPSSLVGSIISMDIAVSSVTDDFVLRLEQLDDGRW